MFDTVLNRIIVFLSVLLLILGLFLAGLFVPPVFALEYEHIYSINNNTFNPSSYSLIVSYGTNLGLDSSVNENVYYYARVSQVDTYSTFVGFYLDNGSKKAVALVKGLPSSTYFTFYSATDRYGGTGNGSADARYSSDYNIHYGIFSSSYYPDSVYYFNSLDSLLSNFVNGDSFTALYDGFQIPAGYLARIEYQSSLSPSSYKGSFTTHFSSNSNFFNGSFGVTSQWYKFDGSLVSPSAILSNGGTTIPWSPFGSTNIWGTSKNGSWSFTGGSDQALYICNPAYRDVYSTFTRAFVYSPDELNNNITVHDPDGYISKIRLYSMASLVNRSTGEFDNSTSATNSSGYTDVVGSTSGAFGYVDSDGNPIVIRPYGDTEVDSSTATTGDIISTIQNAFNNFVSRLEGILHPAEQYFNTLLGSFSNFVSWLSQLWSWLPSPIVSLIEAVLYISILVGLIKLVL